MTYRSLFRAAPLVAALLVAVLASCSDAVSPPDAAPVAAVSISPSAASLTVGGQLTLTATPRAADGSALERAVSWSSEDPVVASVSAAGVVTAHAAGEVGIRASSEGKSGRAVLTINPVPVATVRLSVDNEVVLAWDGTTTVTAVALDAQDNVLQGRSMQWHSTKPSVVAVNHGTLHAIRPGVANVSAIVEGVAATVGVRVLEPPVVRIDIEGATGLEVGEIAAFASKLTLANDEVLYGPVAWTSSAPDVISVEPADLWGVALAAHTVGVATITATRDGVIASVTLRVSPSATQDLIYNRWSGTNSEIFTLGLATGGSEPVRLNAGNVSREPSPSPDGLRYVFAVSQQLPIGDWQHDLYVVNRNGMNMRRLTTMPGIEEQPEWSPDGKQILFHGIVDGRGDLFLINVDGTGLTNLTSGLSAALSDKREAAWSRDGTRITFIGVSGGEYKVWMMAADGTGARQVTTDAGFDRFPTFSPDGQQIAFNRFNTGAPSLGDDVMIVNVNGGAPTRLALPGDQRNPAWSPDGQYIAVNGSAVAGQGQTEIYTLRPDGTGLRLRTINPAWGGGFNPAWIAR